MSMSTPTPSEALTPMNKAVPPSRKTGSAAPSPGGDFAQLLRLQAQSEEAASPQPPTNRPQAETADAQGRGGEEVADSSEDAPSEKSKPPKKLQLGVEDLAAELRPAMASAPASNLLADRARDLAARLSAQGRAQRGLTTEPMLRPETVEDSASADRGLRFGEALMAAVAPEANPAPRTAELPDRPPTAALWADPASSVPPLPEAAPPMNASAQPVETGATSTLAAQATLNQVPGTSAFTEALGVQLSMWVAQGVELAQLELNPRDLGPIEVRIAMHDGLARIELGADVSSTRDALSRALPALAEALGEVGVHLAGSGLADQGGAQRQAQQEGGRQPSAALAALAQAFGRAEGVAGIEEQALLPVRARARSLVDLVA